VKKINDLVKKANLEAYNCYGGETGAKEYYWSLSEDYYYAIVYELVNKHLHVKGKRVCELGCGTAAHLKWYRRDCAEFLGLDISRGMIRRYLSNKGKAKNENFVVADALTLPFKPNAFDVVTIYQSAHHFPCIYRCMDEMGRVSNGFAFFEPNKDSLLHRLVEWRRERAMRDERFEHHSYKLVEYNSRGFSATQIKQYLKSKSCKVRVYYIFSLPMEISANIMRRSKTLFRFLSLFGQALAHIPVFKSQFGNLLVISFGINGAG
jgi:ubiquinone/menaquinone biosynthesis C-methylase UbiE